MPDLMHPAARLARSAAAAAAAAFAVRAAAQPAAAPTPHPDDAAVERRVDSLLARLSPDDRIALLGGTNVFFTRGDPRIGLPSVGTADSPFGVRAMFQGPSTVYAGGVALAASWDPALAERVGAEIGRDARARGEGYSLGPGVNIVRAPQNGRNFEYFGEDPWLASRIAVAFIRGMQAQGSSATIKHFAGNESEYLRDTIDSRIDERTLREIYLPPFEAAVKEADVGAIMPAYNRLNGTYMTANHRLLTDVAKGEWGFRGVMMSDWGAVHSALGAATGGTDLEMPAAVHMRRDSLAPLLASGAVTQAMLDDKVRRQLRNAVRFGWMDRGGAPDPTIPRYNGRGREVALQGAREAMVLLKNEGNLLPFDRVRVKTVAVIGPNGDPAVILGGGSATVPPFHAVSAVEGLGDLLGGGASVFYARGLPSLARMAATTAFTTAPAGGRRGVTVEEFGNAQLTGTATGTRVERAMSLGQPADFFSVMAGYEPPSGGGPSLLGASGPKAAAGMRLTGYYTPTAAGPHDLFLQLGGGGARLSVDGRTVIDTWDAATAYVGQATVTLDPTPHKVVLEYHQRGGGLAGFGAPLLRVGVARDGAWVDPSAVQLAAKADAVVLAVGFSPETESEGWDRTFRLPSGQDALIRAVTAVNPHTVVVVNSGAGYDMTGWIDRAPAVVQAWYPGEYGGRALAELLFGEQNFSGHLPTTFDRRWEDNPTHDSYYPKPGTLEVPYTEGVFVGYRGYDRNHVTPLFPFGHGLSYTTFRFGNLSVAPAAGSAPNDPKYEASFDVTNTGPRAGAAVAQVYVSDGHARVARPAKELKGFAKVDLKPGETRRVTVPLDLRSLAYYDVANKQWRAEAGTFTVRVGGSSADLPLAAPLRLARTATRPVAAR